MLKPDFTFIHTATLRPWLRQGITGPEYGDAIAVKGRFDFTRKKAKSMNAAALEVLASGTFFCAAGTRMEPESLVEFEGKSYTVLSCRLCYDWTGENHVEVEIQ